MAKKYKKYSIGATTNMDLSSLNEHSSVEKALKSIDINSANTLKERKSLRHDKSILKMASDNIKSSDEIIRRNDRIGRLLEEASVQNPSVEFTLSELAKNTFSKNAMSRLEQSKIKNLKEVAKRELEIARLKKNEAQEREKKAQLILATTNIRIKKMQEAKIKDIEKQMLIQKQKEEEDFRKNSIAIPGPDGIQRLRPKEIKEVVHWKKTKTWWFTLVLTLLFIAGVTVFILLILLDKIQF